MDTPQRSTLGRLLRGWRERKNWTLKEMSSRTSIPVSTLSKVERDRLTLTYDKLLLVCLVFLFLFFVLFFLSTTAGEPAVPARRSVGRLADTLCVNVAHYDYYFLCPELRHKRMTPMIVHIRARSLAEFGEPLRHCGEEYVYVLTGAVIVHTDFYEPVVLSAGESIYLDSSMGHAYVAEGGTEATVLAVCSSACGNNASALAHTPAL